MVGELIIITWLNAGPGKERGGMQITSYIMRFCMQSNKHMNIPIRIL